ncbi:MAG: KamA family radical SAM protein [Halopseudomonas sp.]
MLLAKSSDTLSSTNFTELAGIDWRELPWKKELQNNIHSVTDLQRYLPVAPEEAQAMEEIIEQHPMNIPRYYLSLIDPANPDDPIRKLCVPEAEELVVAGAMGETTKDPYGDDKHDKGNGILHKYGYTALVVSTEYCSMYCRHCFRKRLVGLPNDKTVENFKAAARYIASHPEITNVVISGGDTLMLPTSVLRPMLDALKDIPHLNYVRIGTRVPVVYPARFFDDELLELLREFNLHKTLYIPTHFNHPREVTPLAEEAIQRIRATGVSLHNQAVLLKGVNDDSDTLVELMNEMVRIGIAPYYLYQCMPVARVRHHFQIPLKQGIDMVDEARRQLDGYAKRFRYIMGHDIGKIEICGRIEDKVILKQIHARAGEEQQASRMMVHQLNETGGWLDDFEPTTL